MLASAWDAEHFLVSTADRVAGTGTLRLFIGVRSSQPSRPPVSIGPWAPLASRGPPRNRQPPALVLQASLGAPVCAGTWGGSGGETGLSGVRTGGSDLECGPPWPLLSLCIVVKRSLRAGGARG